MKLRVVEPGDEAQTVSPSFLSLFREIGDLKRIRSAGRAGSIAERLFRAGWAALANGTEPKEVMFRLVSTALAATRLGDLDRAKLAELGLDRASAVDVLGRAFDQIAEPIDLDLAAALRAALERDPLPPEGEPPFVQSLAEQPRAGVTCPGLPRLMLQPAENHAEHCLAVTCYGVLLAPVYGADPVSVFLAGMAHHLHSADMPDAGYSGEVLLGSWLGPIIDTARGRAASELPHHLRLRTQLALMPIEHDRTPEARAFHAADVIDRVLEVEQHLTAARADMGLVLREYRLVHDGPVKPFHDRVLTEVGLT